MTSRILAFAASLMLLAACGRQAAAPVEQPTSLASSATPVPSPPHGEGIAPAPTPEAAPPVAEPDKGVKGARNVLLAWARALELGDYDRAFAQWGEQAQARSGMTSAEHAAYWRKFKTVTVSVADGAMEGAAGSSYYQAPVTIVGKQRANAKPYRLEGTVTVRRVNDVEGATPDQLRWHIERVDLAPVT